MVSLCLDRPLSKYVWNQMFPDSYTVSDCYYFILLIAAGIPIFPFISSSFLIFPAGEILPLLIFSPMIFSAPYVLLSPDSFYPVRISFSHGTVHMLSVRWLKTIGLKIFFPYYHCFFFPAPMLSALSCYLKWCPEVGLLGMSSKTIN